MWHAFGSPFQAHWVCCLLLSFTPGWLSMGLAVVVAAGPATRQSVALITIP